MAILDEGTFALNLTEHHKPIYAAEMQNQMQLVEAKLEKMIQHPKTAEYALRLCFYCCHLDEYQKCLCLLYTSSIIFKKRLLHIPNSNSPERTRSILNRVSIFISDRDYVETDLSESRDNGLIKLIETSKQFLEDALSD